MKISTSMRKSVFLAAIGLLLPCSGWAEDWHQIDPPNAPEARFGHSMVSLSDGRVLVFGGENGAAHLFHDLHEFTGNAWNQVIPSNEPPPPLLDHIAWARDNEMYF